MICYGLIGYPIAHSKSPELFEQMFQKFDLKGREYRLFPLQDPSKVYELAQDQTLKGLNVTVPWKSSIINYLDDIDEKAKAIGAVNCISIEHTSGGPWLKGYNTDVMGFWEDLKAWGLPSNPKALVLGNGGASKAVTFALEWANIPYQVLARSPRNSMELDWAKAPWSIWREANLIVHTTPVGMTGIGDRMPFVPKNGLDHQPRVYDLVYAPSETPFMLEAQAQGCKVKNGLGMLQRQAELALELWEKDLAKAPQ